MSGNNPEQWRSKYNNHVAQAERRTPQQIAESMIGRITNDDAHVQVAKNHGDDQQCVGLVGEVEHAPAYDFAACRLAFFAHAEIRPGMDGSRARIRLYETC